MANGEEGFGKLFLAELTKEIALVFVWIGTRQEAVHGTAVDRGLLFSAIVAGGDEVGSCFKHLIEEDIKLDFAVAEDIGIGGAPGPVFGEHIVNDPFFVVFAEVDDPEGDVQFFCHHFRDQGIVFPGTGSRKGAGTVMPVDHEES